MEKEYSLVTPTGFRINENREYRLPVILFSFFCGGDLSGEDAESGQEKDENEVAGKSNVSIKKAASWFEIDLPG
jgi:hypothetical protein